MIRLKERFKKKSKGFTQVYRNDDMALYLVYNEYDYYVEVFKIKMHKADKYHDDEYEVYPCDESFGDWAWCCSTRKSLEKIMNREFPNVPIPNILINKRNCDGAWAN